MLAGLMSRWMRRVECVRNLDTQIQDAIHFHRLAGDHVLEGHPLKQFHHDQGVPIVLDDVVDRTDAGMIQGGRGLCLAAETRDGLKVKGNVVRKELERDQPMKASVFGLVNDAHPTAPDLFDDEVVGDRLANHPSGPSCLRMLVCVRGRVNEFESCIES
jgi:hypothetical protein